MTGLVKYIRVHWLHDEPDDPIVLHSELDSTRFEARKVEVFREGRLGYASAEGEHGGTLLGVVPVPDLNEIAQERQFLPAEISREEFESLWARRGRALTPNELDVLAKTKP